MINVNTKRCQKGILNLPEILSVFRHTVFGDNLQACDEFRPYQDNDPLHYIIKPFLRSDGIGSGL